MKKTIAQKYCRDFEYFVLEYLKDNYHITNENLARLTPPTGDGGYDGVIYWIKNSAKMNMQETLFEAKLRSALGHALPMNDFSKALIIAVNRFSDELYIATNLSFSLETMYQLETFSNRTGITIKTLNGKDLFRWFQKNASHSTLDFDAEFIDFIRESADRIIDNRLVNNNSNRYQQITLSYIQDYTRGKSIDDLLDMILYSQNGTVLIEGSRGCGKSRLAVELQDRLEQHGYLSAEINIKNSSTSRDIFLSLLQIIWGISPTLIVDYSEEELDIIFSEIGGETLKKDKVECLKQIFHKEVEDYTGHWDIYQLYLLEIIDKLFSHYTKKRNYCIHIHNLDTGYYESCLFVLKIISRLEKYQILFLVELRNDYCGDISITSDMWSEIYTRFVNLSSLIKEYHVCEFSSVETEKYITMKVPELSKNQIDILKEEISNNPLILNSTLDILAPKLATQNLLAVEFQTELDFFKRTYESEIVRQLIRNKIRFGGLEQLAMPLVIISLLNGKCKVRCIYSIIEYEKNQLIEDFINTGIFYVHDDIIQIKHELYLNSLHNYSDYISILSLQELAKKMLDKIDIFYSDALQKEMLRLKLLNILGTEKELLNLSCEVGKTLLKQGDFQQALYVYELGYKVLENGIYNELKYTLIELEILKKMLYIHTNSKGDNTIYIQELLDKFHYLIEYNRRNLKHNDAYIDACLNEIIYKMKRLHRLNRHSECLALAYKARRLAQKADIYHKYPETMEQILWLKSLSVKHVSGIQACMQSFESDITKNPNLPLLMYSYNTHKTATISRKHPNFALKYFKANEKYYSALSMADQLHNRVNIANMHFFLRQYSIAFDLANSITSDALTYDVKMELGRIYNLLGNYYFIFDDKEMGITFYKKSIQIFEEMNNLIHLWPSLVNISSVYIDDKEYDNALLYLKKTIDIIVSRKNELKGDKYKDVNDGSKLYIGTIVILHNLYIISTHIKKAYFDYIQLAEEIKQFIPSCILEIVESADVFKNFFEKSAYEHNSKIVLKN